jgi:UDP-N-acetylglucosamine transferase subunit ALG13
VTRLLLASTGGHLTELVFLAPKLWPPAEDELWVTFDSTQSRTLLAGRRVQFIRETRPRDWRSVLLNIRPASRLLNGRVDSIVSSGAGVALSFLPLARARGIPAHYIESSARVQGPSVTGRLLSHVRGIRMYTQHESLADANWNYAGSVFDGFEAADVADPPPLRRVFVTLGTLGFPFVGLLERLRTILPPTVAVTVQDGTGAARFDWPGAAVTSMMTLEELRSAMKAADVVVAHAGIGSALVALEAGRMPILVPRLQSRGEHVDDHQVQTCRNLADRGLAVTADSTTIAREHFAQALRRRVELAAGERRFVLL